MAPRTVVAAVDDVLFVSRLQEVANSRGAKLLTAKSPEECLAHLSAGPADLVLFDMNARGFDSVALLDALSSGGWSGKVRVVGFVRHTDEAKIQQVRAKGGCEILPRSAFVKHLPELISGQSQPV